MATTQLKKIVLLIGFAQCAALAQENAIVQTPDALARKFEAEFKKTTNEKFLAFAGSVGKNPEIFLSTVSIFYSQTCQSLENRTWYAYLRHPYLNFQKSIAYLSLSRSVNQQVYTPHVKTVIERMSRPIDLSLATSTEHQDMRDAQIDCLATLTDHPALAQKAAALFAQQWAFNSVLMDLTSQQENLKALKEAFEHDKQKQLALSEQNDNEVVKLKKRIKQNIYSLTRAIDAIAYRQEINEINQDPLAFILQRIRNKCLKDALKKCEHAFSTEEINKLFKAKNDRGNGLIHELCISSELSDDQKEYGIRILEEQYGININEYNTEGKTALDLIDLDPKNNATKQVLRVLGGEKSLPKVASLKKSFDTPPSSPDSQIQKPRVQTPHTTDLPKYHSKIFQQVKNKVA